MPPPDIDALSPAELKSLVLKLFEEGAELRRLVAALRDEIARLKGGPGRPDIKPDAKPSGMEKASEAQPSDPSGERRRRGGTRAKLTIHEERTLEADAPPGSRFKGYASYLMQDLMIRPHVTDFRRECWQTPDGTTVMAPLPAGVDGHFGPELRRFVLAQYHQGQVTAARLVTLLRGFGIEAIALVMQRMNDRPMRNLGLSRRELFEKIERDALLALPADDWEFAEWRRARVNLDYHIEVHDFLYSVPHALIRVEVDVRITARTVEIFHRGQRVGVHQRRYMGRKHGTDPDHMPSSHRRYAEWTPDRFRRWAGKIGPNTEGLISAVLASRPHPEQGFRTCLGILRTYRGLDPVRVEAVSARAVELGVLNCKGVASLLARKCDPAAAKDGRPATLFDHANLRGPGYYH